MELHSAQNTQNKLEKEPSWKTPISQFKTYYKSTKMQTVVPVVGKGNMSSWEAPAGSCGEQKGAGKNKGVCPVVS